MCIRDSLQGDLIENRVDVVFEFRDLYTPRQIRIIRSRLEQHIKEVSTGKKTKKVRKLEVKKIKDPQAKKAAAPKEK